MGQCQNMKELMQAGAVVPAFFTGGSLRYIKPKRNVPEELVNENIHFHQVLVIDQDGRQLGVMLRREALQKAYDENLDLYCVAPNANPPVCKILDFGKYHFNEQKKAKEAKKKQTITEIKPMRLSPVIDQHDFDTKLKQARGWIEDGQKVKIDMRFRGRMITRQEVGRAVMNKFIEQMSDVAQVEKAPSMEGNTMSVVLSPKKKGRQQEETKNESQSEKA